MGIVFEIPGAGVLGGKGVAIGVVEFLVREPVVPRGAVGHEAVPATGAPGLRDPRLFEDDVVDTTGLQVRTHGDPGLSGAHDQSINLHYIHT